MRSSAMIPSRPFDLVLLDWRMPGLDRSRLPAGSEQMDHSNACRRSLLSPLSVGRRYTPRLRARALKVSWWKPVNRSMLVDMLVEIFAPEHGSGPLVDNHSHGLRFVVCGCCWSKTTRSTSRLPSSSSKVTGIPSAASPTTVEEALNMLFDGGQHPLRLGRGDGPPNAGDGRLPSHSPYPHRI